ncbi:MAG: hypothetical protein BWY75_03547 [bacterium ADurb.Bin425]|nr:MAG: hypothetical protein BWY75_03547 [bacterium ADurb.Bin425]
MHVAHSKRDIAASGFRNIEVVEGAEACAYLGEPFIGYMIRAEIRQRILGQFQAGHGALQLIVHSAQNQILFEGIFFSSLRLLTQSHCWFITLGLFLCRIFHRILLRLLLRKSLRRFNRLGLGGSNS